MKMLRLFTRLLPMVVASGFFVFAPAVNAEPYLAVRTGNKCSSCHVNPTGGGKRTEFGAVYARTGLAEEEWTASSGNETDKSARPWDGRLTDYFAFGGDLRTNLKHTKIPNQNNELAFETDEAIIYLELSVIPNRFLLYIDESVAPGAALNRESFALLWSKDKSTYLKAGRFFQPFGLRLEDDSAFIRQSSGINFNSSDTGVEAGFEQGNWAGNFAITNGASGVETDTGKQYSLLATYLRAQWRVGASLNYNDHDTNDRKMANVFFGLRTGIISWLAEYDFFTDELTTGRRESEAGFIEANIEIKRGHNVKLTFDSFNPDRNVADDQRDRISLVWEYTPFQHLQLRTGYRHNEGPVQNNLQNTEELFVQLHTFL